MRSNEEYRKTLKALFPNLTFQQANFHLPLHLSALLLRFGQHMAGGVMALTFDRPAHTPGTNNKLVRDVLNLVIAPESHLVCLHS